MHKQRLWFLLLVSGNQFEFISIIGGGGDNENKEEEAALSALVDGSWMNCCALMEGSLTQLTGWWFVCTASGASALAAHFVISFWRWWRFTTAVVLWGKDQVFSLSPPKALVKAVHCVPDWLWAVCLKRLLASGKWRSQSGGTFNNIVIRLLTSLRVSGHCCLIDGNNVYLRWLFVVNEGIRQERVKCYVRWSIFNDNSVSVKWSGKSC